MLLLLLLMLMLFIPILSTLMLLLKMLRNKGSVVGAFGVWMKIEILILWLAMVFVKVCIILMWETLEFGGGLVIRII